MYWLVLAWWDGPDLQPAHLGLPVRVPLPDPRQRISDLCGVLALHEKVGNGVPVPMVVHDREHEQREAPGGEESGI